MHEKPEQREDLSKTLENLRRILKAGPTPEGLPSEGEGARVAPTPRIPERVRVAAPVAGKAKPGRAAMVGSRRILLFGGVTALLHFGLKRGSTDTKPGMLAVLAGNVARLSNTTHDVNTAGPVQLAQARPSAAFSTDFTEPEPLRHWWQLEPDGLIVEPFETQMSAVPRGPSLAKPTRTMTDGQAYFTFVQQRREAGFILRGQDERDCYRVLYFPQITNGKPEMVFSARRRRRGVEREIARRTITDLRLASMSRQHISVSMEGSQFAARLHWEEPSVIPGWPSADQEMVIATWRDDTFRDGAVGVWGPERRQEDSEFRLLTVATRV